jgi:FeS assembly SUF system protein
MSMDNDMNDGKPATEAAGGATSAEETRSSLTKPPSIAEGGTPVPGSRLSREELNYLRRRIVQQLKTVRDPEIPVDIYELGLIYLIDIDDDWNVRIDMTLTAPACPVAGEMPRWVHDAVSQIEEVQNVGVNMVFDPPWDPNLMSDEARLELGMF